MIGAYCVYEFLPVLDTQPEKNGSEISAKMMLSEALIHLSKSIPG